tara:strand:- start:818 stop:1567 length:750 start_codon:yes stop_codon:yes gene_type:complete
MNKLTQDSRPDKESMLAPPVTLGEVASWSYSALKVFEECPYRTYLARVQKIPDPSGPAAERGTLIHEQAEDFVSGALTKFPTSLSKFNDEFDQLRTLYNEGSVELEGEWAFTTDWQITGWKSNDCWARIKLDALVNENETSARVIDYKTGRKFGNEMAHSQQCLLYAIATFMRYPNLEFLNTELWYLDHGETTTHSYTREEALLFLPSIHKRAVKMTTSTNFQPRPSKYNCKWCNYKKGDTPACEWGIL